MEVEMLEHDPRASAILHIISEETGIDPGRLTPDATLDELGLSSLDLVETLFKIESHFNIEIPSSLNAQHTGATVEDFLTSLLAVIPAESPAVAGRAGIAQHAS